MMKKKRRAVASSSARGVQRSRRPRTEARPWCAEIRLPAAKVAQSIQSREGHAIAADTALASDARARRMFEWLIAPVTADEFYTTYYQKRPFLIRRGHMGGGGDGMAACQAYYDGWLTSSSIETMLRQHKLRLGEDIDITRYAPNGLRQNFHPSATADADCVRQHYAAGCSVRVLRPHRWSEPLWTLLSELEQEWGRAAGFRTSAFLTPPGGSRALAPHYDDIEAFVLQLEGRKRWRLYMDVGSGASEGVGDKDEAECKILTWDRLLEEGPATRLPRLPSRNFKEHELPKLVLDAVLEPGDLMYMPRGCIHQAVTITAEDRDKSCAGDGRRIAAHSLHLTISCGSGTDLWANGIEAVMPRAVKESLYTHTSERGSGTAESDFASNSTSQTELEGSSADKTNHVGECRVEDEHEASLWGKFERLCQRVLDNCCAAISARQQVVVSSQSALEAIEGELTPALRRIISQDADFREALPRALALDAQLGTFARHSGTRARQLVSSSDIAGGEGWLALACRCIMERCRAPTSLHAYADDTARTFLHERLPPRFYPAERRCRCNEPPPGGSTCEIGELPIDSLSLASRVRLVRSGVARIVVESAPEGESGHVLVLHHSLHNTRSFRDALLPALEFAVSDGPALQQLVNSHPQYVKVGELQCEDDTDKLELARSIFAEGLLTILLPQVTNT